MAIRGILFCQPMTTYRLGFWIDDISFYFSHPPHFLQVPSIEGVIISEAALTKSAFLEYGRLLLTVGNVGGARYYAKRAGSCAEALLKDATAVETAFVKNAQEKKDARVK